MEDLSAALLSQMSEDLPVLRAAVVEVAAGDEVPVVKTCAEAPLSTVVVGMEAVRKIADLWGLQAEPLFGAPSGKVALDQRIPDAPGLLI